MKFCISWIIFVSQLYLVLSDRTLNDYLRNVVNNIKVMMPRGDPSIGVPIIDPYIMNDINISTSQRRVKINLTLQKLSLTGASKFIVQDLHVNLDNRTMMVDVLFEKLTMVGQYDVKGILWNIFPLYGKGEAMIRIKDFRINATMGFNVNSSSGRMENLSFDMNLDFGEAHMNLENILGGGRLGKLVNMLANSLLRPLFRKNKSKIEGLIKEGVSKILEKELNNIDTRQFMEALPIRSKRSVRSIRSIQLPDRNSVNDYIDRLLNNAKSNPHLQIDPFDIPNQSFNDGMLEIRGARVHGLRSVHRVGDMALDCNQDPLTCVFCGKIKFNNIQVNTHTTIRSWWFFTIRPPLDCKVAKIEIQFRIHLNLQGGQGGVATLQYFEASQFSTPKIIIQGEGILVAIGNLLTGFFEPWVRDELMKAIKGPLKNVLNESLKNVSFE